MRIVFCFDGQQWSHAGQETIRQQFPALMDSNGTTSGRKLFASSFLPPWTAMAQCRTGHFPRSGFPKKLFAFSFPLLYNK